MTVQVGGKNFTVSCQDGEESYLSSAAEMLDREAQTLVSAGARLTTDRMLLMAGLMLADRAISADEELRGMDRRLAQQTKELDEFRNRPAPAPERVEVEVVKEVEVVREVVPEASIERLEALAKKAEELAAKARENRAVRDGNGKAVAEG
ncbi:cell division protein ZapA [Jannaschia sp. LMIT008]|uniref:cell division protein ZapA n=1 Tax=Jannaschia maritima TaxID=3032585 RepID=UPI002811B244|nr:cell division protein ZapA [Jannaschia sp. LMIT008]